MKIYYNPKLKELARKLRKSGTLAEILLWDQLKSKKLHGYQFMRQKPIDNYIVDFFCSKLKLIVEIDGITHEHKLPEDRFRQERLESLGLNFLRFTEKNVRSDMFGVIREIESYIVKFEEGCAQG